MEGWIKLHRRIEHNWIWKDPRKAVAFIHILFRANYEDTEVLIDGKIRLVPRGSFITSYRKLAKEIPLSLQETRTFIGLLESNTVINTLATQSATQITICKYDDYQDKQHTPVPKSTHSATTDKEEKKKKEKKENIKRKFEVHPRVEKRFLEWLEYKKDRRETYKSETSKELALKKLVKFSGNDPLAARKIIEEAMSNNYAGFFDPATSWNNSKPRNGKLHKVPHGTRSENPDFANAEVEVIQMTFPNPKK